MAVGAVDNDDVRVTDPRKLSRLMQDAIGRVPIGDFGLEELEGNGMIQPRVVRVIHLAKGTLANLAEENEMAPLTKSTLRGASISIRGRRLPTGDLGGDIVCCRRDVAERPMDFGNISHDAKQFEETTQFAVSPQPVDLFPID